MKDKVQDDYLLTDNDLYYLRSIYSNITEFKKLVNETSFGPTLGGEILADNWNWLDCFIDQHTRARQPLNKGDET